MLDWQDLDVAIAAAEQVLLITHVRPDGDALGSELAFADLLEQKGKRVEIFNPSPTPERYRFLDPAGERIQFQTHGRGLPFSSPDLLVILDTGTWSQLAGLADYVRESPARKFVIDHHVSQDELGATRLVDTAASACGMLVHQAFRHLNVELAPAAAEALYLAIAMDTGWVRHSNTTAEVLHVLAELVQHGAKPHELYRRLYENNSLPRLKLLSVMLQRITLAADGRLASSYLLLDDIRAAGAHLMDTEDFITYPMSMAGAETAVFFIEQEGGGTKVSFRSRGGLDCSRLAQQFGGGGHRPAAGAIVDLSITDARSRVLHTVELAMKNG